MQIDRRAFLQLASASIAGWSIGAADAAGSNFEVTLKHYEDENRIVRSSIGGRPIMAAGQTWPQCSQCKKNLALVIQFDIKPEFNIPLATGSHLLVFSCPEHEGAPYDFDSANPDSENCLILNPPGVKEIVLPPEPSILQFELEFTGEGDRGARGINLRVPGTYVKPRETCKLCGSEYAQIWYSANETLDFPVKRECSPAGILMAEKLIGPPFNLSPSQIAKLPRGKIDPRRFRAAHLWLTSVCSRLYACKKQCSPYSVRADLWN